MRDHQSIGRAERAEAALAVKEAECDSLRARLRELEMAQLRSRPDSHFAPRLEAPPVRYGEAQAATRVQAHVRGRNGPRSQSQMLERGWQEHWGEVRIDGDRLVDLKAMRQVCLSRRSRSSSDETDWST